MNDGNEIVTAGDVPENELALQSAYELLATVPEESIWLANFTSKNTRDSYRKSIAEFVHAMEISTAEELYAAGQSHIITWREQLSANGMSNRTVTARLSALSSLFKHLADKQLCPVNPVTGVKRPKVSAATVSTPAITPEQVRAMLDAPMMTLDNLGKKANPSLARLQALRDRALLHVYFYAGSRVSEPCNLKVKDLMMDKGYWVLDFKVKGDKQIRVAIHPECVNAIQEYLDVAGHGDDRNGYLLRQVKHSRDNKAMSRGQFNNLFKKYAKLAGMPDGVVPHSARATLITEALDKKADVADVRDTVGHSSVTTTLMYDKRKFHPKRSASFVVDY